MESFARRVSPAATLLFALFFCIVPALAADPGTFWPTCTPASLGLIDAKLDELRAATGWTATSTTYRGFVAKSGCKVKSWGSEKQKADWASAVKPLMSTMLFWAIKEGRTSGVNAKIAPYGWDMTAPDQSMTWRHLANMISGYALPDNPGAAWAYNDYGIALYCKTLFPQVYEQTMATVVADRLAALQFEDGGVIGSGRNGCQLYTSVRDAARIGQFWMNKGRWQGVQLLPASYFDNFRKNQVAATLPRSAYCRPDSTDCPLDDYLGVSSTGGSPNQDFTLQGAYGYNWWFNTPRHLFSAGPSDTFMAVGHNGAEPIIVIPSLQIVFACKCKNAPSFAEALANINTYLRLIVEAHASS
jgi:hypothetical protein